jgi:hypothetical protein
MIIVEGCDGSGKDTLIQSLASYFQLPVHERACTSEGGPIDDLYSWVQRDVLRLQEQPLSIYNRHPLVSEYIYGPIVRQFLPQEFTTTNAHLLIRMLAQRSFLIVCEPPMHEVAHNLSAQPHNAQMPGVFDHFPQIYSAYQTMRQFWPGQVMTYNYTYGQDHFNGLLSALRIHVATERNYRHAA